MCCFTFAMHIHKEYNVLLGDWLVKGLEVIITFSHCKQFVFFSVSSKLRLNKKFRKNFKSVKDFFYLFIFFPQQCLEPFTKTVS